MVTLDHIERLAKSVIIELHGIHCTDLLLEKGTSPEFNSRLKAIEGVSRWTIPLLTLLPITPPGLPKVRQDADRAAFA